jgi:hypothetical protein
MLRFAHRTVRQIADLVAPRLGVLAAINLDDQSGLEADEVDDVTVERCLPPEFQAFQLPAAQRLPEDVLGFRRIGAHGASKRAVRRRDVAMESRLPSAPVRECPSLAISNT